MSSGRTRGHFQIFSKFRKLVLDICRSSGYNNQAVFRKGSECGCAGTGRQASLRCWCRSDVWVQVPSAAPTDGSNRDRRSARVVELADSLDSGSSVHYGRAGSSPASRTKKKRHPKGCRFFFILPVLLSYFSIICSRFLQ